MIIWPSFTPNSVAINLTPEEPEPIDAEAVVDEAMEELEEKEPEKEAPFKGFGK